MPRGANLPAIAAFNDTVVLDAVRRSAGGLSRVELAGETGLSAQTVSNVSRRLIEQGLIREAGKRIGGPGKPRTILQLEPTGSYAVGVHLDPTVITCVLLDLEGEVVAEVRRHSPASGDAMETLTIVVGAIGAVLTASAVDRAKVSGVGVAAPGPLDTATGVVVRPPLIPSWNDFHLRDELTAATGLPALVAKDVTAAAVAERWRDPAGASRDYVFLYYGTGVGVGMVLDGEVYTGATQNAGDVGHSIVDPGGALCACGRRGCYGESVRPYRLVMQAIWAGIVEPPGGELVPDGVELGLDVETIDALFTELTDAAAAGDAVATEILDRSIRNTAFYLSNLSALLDIDRIVFGGPSWGRLEPFYLDRLPGWMREYDTQILTHPVLTESSAVGADVAAVGAACLVLDATFSPRGSLA